MKYISASFSLVELLITISIASILVALTLPYFSSFSRFYVAHELENLIATLSYVQSKALATNKDLDVVFDLHNHAYSYPGPSGKLISHRLHNRVIFGNLPEAKGPPSDPRTPIMSPITFHSDPQSEGKITAHFRRDGGISSGSIYLADGPKTIMASLTIAVEEKGFMRKYWYDNNLWISP